MEAWKCGNERVVGLRVNAMLIQMDSGKAQIQGPYRERRSPTKIEHTSRHLECSSNNLSNSWNGGKWAAVG
jgi:hypothetical protein